MIIDHIDNRERYYSLGVQIERGLRYLAVTDFATISVGEYSVDGDGLFAIVDEYTPVESLEKQLEAHREKIDIQFMASGSESLEYAPLKEQRLLDDRFENSDVGFYEGEGISLDLHENMFAIFFPEDLHKPGVGEWDNRVKKVVVKVPVKKENMVSQPCVEQ